MNVLYDGKDDNVMVDLETLNNVPGGVILSIGATVFGPRGLGAQFYTVVDRSTCLMAGLSIGNDTLDWWEKQSPEAREVLVQAMDPMSSQPLSLALAGFATWMDDNVGLDRVKVWGNGGDFDNAFLQAAYAAVGRPLPWKFWNNRCYRTLKNMVGRKYFQIKPPEREGTHHNALDDACHQAQHAVELLRVLDHAESTYETATLAKSVPGTNFHNVKTDVRMVFDAPECRLVPPLTTGSGQAALTDVLVRNTIGNYYPDTNGDGVFHIPAVKP